MEIKKSDVSALETKLQSFAQGLPEQEQNVLNWILARAKADSATEVSDADLDSASGGSAAEADSVGVSVSWSR